MLSYNWPKIYALNSVHIVHLSTMDQIPMHCTCYTSFNRLCGDCVKKKYLYRQSSQIFWNHLKKKQKLRNILDLHIHIYICINQTTLKTVRAMLIWVPSKFVYHMKEELRKNSNKYIDTKHIYIHIYQLDFIDKCKKKKWKNGKSTWFDKTLKIICLHPGKIERYSIRRKDGYYTCIHVCPQMQLRRQYKHRKILRLHLSF